jgi:hypothetical protein
MFCAGKKKGGEAITEMLWVVLHMLCSFPWERLPAVHSGGPNRHPTSSTGEWNCPYPQLGVASFSLVSCSGSLVVEKRFHMHFPDVQWDSACSPRFFCHLNTLLWNASFSLSLIFLFSHTSKIHLQVWRNWHFQEGRL